MEQMDTTQYKRVIIIRHEPTRENRKGIIQGQNIDGVLENSVIDPIKLNWLSHNISGSSVILCSSLARAEHSGKLISLTLGIPIIILPLLKQRCWGIVEGKTLKELGISFVKNAFSADADKLAPGAETLSDVWARAHTVWGFIFNLTERTIIVVTHDEFSNYLVNDILGEGLFKRPLLYNEAHIVELHDDNTIVSVELHVAITKQLFLNRVIVREDAPTFRAGENGLGIRILNNRGIGIVNPPEIPYDPDSVSGIVIGDKLFTDDDMIEYPKLRVVSRFGKGIDNVRINCHEGVYITNTPTCNERAVAEFTVGQILELVRKVNFSRTKLVNQGLWERPFTQEWRQVTVGVIGLGSIGKIVVQILVNIGFKMFAWTAHPNKHSEFLQKYNIQLKPTVNELCSSVDIITIHTSANNDTTGLIGMEQFKLMRVKNACLVNTARHELVDYIALETALMENWIGGAAIDVWPEEPIKSSWLKQLISNPNIIATPHIAGRTKVAMNKAISLCAYNIAWVLNGRSELASCVVF